VLLGFCAAAATAKTAAEARANRKRVFIPHSKPPDWAASSIDEEGCAEDDDAGFARPSFYLAVCSRISAWNPGSWLRAAKLLSDAILPGLAYPWFSAIRKCSRAQAVWPARAQSTAM
jgi:hypothetical protein